jgi:hypothetical protein
LHPGEPLGQSPFAVQRLEQRFPPREGKLAHSPSRHSSFDVQVAWKGFLSRAPSLLASIVESPGVLPLQSHAP